MLLTAQFPNAVDATGAVFFELTSGGSVVANTSYTGVRRGAAMMALVKSMSGSTPVQTQWQVAASTSATIANDRANLTATLFKPGSNVMSTSVQGTASTTSMTYQDIPGVAGTLALSAKRRVLYALQLDRAYTAGAGPQGAVSVFIDGKATTTAYIQSENSDFPQPLTIVGMADLDAGNHTFTGRFKIYNGTQLLTGADSNAVTNLIAIPME